MMKRIAFICVIATFLAAVLVGGTVAVNHPTAHACGSYVVSGSTTEAEFYINNQWTYISFSLWYNSCNSTNWGSANITGGSLPAHSWSVEVGRLSGPDGGAETLSTGCSNSTGVCNSPTVYSPNNKALALISLGVSSGADSTIMTDAF